VLCRSFIRFSAAKHESRTWTGSSLPFNHVRGLNTALQDQQGLRPSSLPRASSPNLFDRVPMDGGTLLMPPPRQQHIAQTVNHV
jgi:hypothetical protein